MKIGLLDHMGYGNLGDAATQDALIAHIRQRVPEAQIVGFSLNPVDTERRHGIPSYSITNWHPGLNQSMTAAYTGRSSNIILKLKLLLKKIPVLSTMLRWIQNLMREASHLRRSYSRVRSIDCLIIAGGGQLGELWRGPWAHPYNVLKFSMLSKLARKKLLILNVGAGPLESRLGKAFIKWSVQMADYVSFRDVESQALIQRLGIRRETYVQQDSAYALDVSQYLTRYTAESKPLVGINPIGFCDPRIWPRSDALAYSRYLDCLAEFMSWLSSEGYRLKIYCGERSVDVYAVEDLKDRLRTALPAEDVDKLCGKPVETVRDLLTEMARFDFVITSKFHGVVFSHLLAKPIVAISYHRKIDDLMRAAGDSEYCLNIESFDSASLRSAFVALVENGPHLKIKSRQIVANRAESLNRQFDDLLVLEKLQPRLRQRGTAIADPVCGTSEWRDRSSALKEGER